ncbi:MAG TPA: hypothetical protein VHW96_10390 [Solirubrobacteraceae bacterium]|nr:hypothetical protein [Solirubrobacteraceae bacterium]
MSVSKPGTGGWAALAVMCLLLVVPASAHARRLYINVELSEAYDASQPTGEQSRSAATVSAYYRTTTQALSSGDGTLELTPTATLGTFTAALANSVLGVPLDCSWHGAPGGGHQLAELQDGTPFAHALSIQWPGYPGMWEQTLSSASTGKCRATFTDIPVQGEVKWALGSGGGTGGGNHFIFAAVPRNKAVESRAASASAAGMTMTSLLAGAGGASYAVVAQGFLVESTVPFAGHRDLLPAPSIPPGGEPRPPLRASALRKLGLTLLPKRIPSGCVAGQKRRPHQRCP